MYLTFGGSTIPLLSFWQIFLKSVRLESWYLPPPYPLLVPAPPYPLLVPAPSLPPTYHVNTPQCEMLEQPVHPKVWIWLPRWICLTLSLSPIHNSQLTTCTWHCRSRGGMNEAYGYLSTPVRSTGLQLVCLNVRNSSRQILNSSDIWLFTLPPSLWHSHQAPLTNLFSRLSTVKLTVYLKDQRTCATCCLTKHNNFYHG